mgnify:FL=1
MANTYERGSGTDIIRFASTGSEMKIPMRVILQELNVQNIIRIPNDVYPNEAACGETLVHFNLPIPDEPANEKVVLPRIIEYGYFRANGEEELPLLSFKNVWLARVTRLIQSTGYDALPEDCFQNVIGGATNITELLRLILARYKHVLPDSTEESILSKGVSIRYLELSQKTFLSEFAVAQRLTV